MRSLLWRDYFARNKNSLKLPLLSRCPYWRSRRNNILWLLYESDGNRVGFTYNDTAYYYTKNAQGDVTGIVDGNCNTVVEYSYDAWGKLLSTIGSMADSIGQKNPFLYRGYYYDSETGMYYLNSRYYDPQTGRFINADGQFNPDTGLAGNNLFVYCNNNPINASDYNGARFTESDDGSGRWVNYINNRMYSGTGRPLLVVQKAVLIMLVRSLHL